MSIRKEDRKSKTCKYSASCYECPLDDCKIGSTIASAVNMIDYDFEKKYSKNEEE